jgi:hypothetical protein
MTVLPTPAPHSSPMNPFMAAAGSSVAEYRARRRRHLRRLARLLPTLDAADLADPADVLASLWLHLGRAVTVLGDLEALALLTACQHLAYAIEGERPDPVLRAARDLCRQLAPNLR